MKWLAIETSSAKGLVGVTNGEQYFEQSLGDGRTQSEQILIAIEQILTQANLSRTDLDAIAVSEGPGAFTGLRVGISVAQALAYAMQIPVYPINSLQILAQQALRTLQLSKVLVANDARIQEVYWQEFAQVDAVMLPLMEDAHVSSPEQCIANNAQALPVVGDAASVYPEMSKYFTTCHFMSAELIDIITLANFKQAKGQACDVLMLTPRYIRNKVAETATKP